LRWTVGCGHNKWRKTMVYDFEHELKVLYQRIENEKTIVCRDIDEIIQRLERLDKYVKDMTYFCSGVAVVLTFILYSLISKGLFF
jgi:hypothetical protein